MATIHFPIMADESLINTDCDPSNYCIATDLAPDPLTHILPCRAEGTKNNSDADE